jgi:amino acid transporter
MLIIGLCTVVLITGAKESARFNTAMTILNLSVLGFVLLAGLGSGTVHTENLTPVFPHGITGMARGAGLVFFAYLGFDMVACLSEEVQRPERNMPIGIIGSLIVSMSIYVFVSIVVVGMAPVALLGEEIPIINALLANGCCSHTDQLLFSANSEERDCLDYSCSPLIHPVLYYGSRVVSFGAIFGLTTATFACLMGQPRIFYSMAQDGLLFKIYARVHPKTGVPTAGTLLTGLFTALIACLIDLESLANAISLGTLQVFTFVNAGVIILRMRPPPAADICSDDHSAASADFETSPLVYDPRAALMARSLGLVKLSSRDIQNSIRTTFRSSNVHENGTKPQWLTLLFTVSCVLASTVYSFSWIIGALCVFGSMGAAVFLFRLPQSPPPDTFACPFVPFVPIMGILCNCYMMGSMPVRLGNTPSFCCLLVYPTHYFSPLPIFLPVVLDMVFYFCLAFCRTCVLFFIRYLQF